MNRKINKITTWLAAAIFLFALAINVKVTLDDPFMMLSDEAIAQTSSSTDSNSTGTGTLPEILNSIGESKSCLKEFCIEIGWDPIKRLPIISCRFEYGTKVDCNPGGTSSCQPSLCI